MVLEILETFTLAYCSLHPALGRGLPGASMSQCVWFKDLEWAVLIQGKRSGSYPWCEGFRGCVNVCMHRWCVCTVMLNPAPSRRLVQFGSLMPERLSVLAFNRPTPLRVRSCLWGWGVLVSVSQSYERRREEDKNERWPQRSLQPSCLNTGARLTGLPELKRF